MTPPLTAVNARFFADHEQIPNSGGICDSFRATKCMCYSFQAEAMEPPHIGHYR